MPISNDEVNGLIKALDGDDWQQRWNAIKQLGTIRSNEAVSKLSRCLDDPDLDIRAAAEEALCRIASAEALAALERRDTDRMEQARKSLLDNSQPVKARIAALELLAEKNPDDFDSILKACVLTGDPKLKRKALKLFSCRAKADSIPMLLAEYVRSYQDAFDGEIQDATLNILQNFRQQIGPSLLLPFLPEKRLYIEPFARLVSLIGDLSNSQDLEALGELMIEYMKKDQESCRSVGMKGVSESFALLERALSFMGSKDKMLVAEGLRELTASKKPVCERCHKPLRMEDRDSMKVEIGLPSSYLGTVCKRCGKVECYNCRRGVGLPCSWCGGDVDGAFVQYFR